MSITRELFTPTLSNLGYEPEYDIRLPDSSWKKPIAAVGVTGGVPRIVCDIVDGGPGYERAATIRAYIIYRVAFLYDGKMPSHAWIVDRDGENDFFWDFNRSRRVSRLPAADEDVALDIFARQIFKEKIPPIREFFQSDEYLDLGDLVFHNVLQLAEVWDKPEYHECWWLGGKGGGKSTLTAGMMLRGVERILCMRDWRKTLRVPTGDIFIANTSNSADQAQEVVFAKVLGLLKRSRWFRGKFKEGTEKVTFHNGPILVSGHSKNSRILGHDIFYGVLDEADFFLDKRDKSNATVLYNALKSQSRTRFPAWWKIFVISSLGEGQNTFMWREKERIEKTGSRLDIIEQVDRKVVPMQGVA